MTLAIRLLGRPTTTIDGREAPRRLAGKKPWALLAYVILDHGATRRELAEVLWPEADDPLAAMRWAILQVRRALEPAATLVDANGSLNLVVGPTASGVAVDALTLLDGRFESADVDHLVGGDLLEGMAFPDAPAFEDWLGLQRARTTSAASAALRWAALVDARTEPGRALRLVDRALAFDPYDDAAHELGIRIEAERGASASALARLNAAERRYRTELLIEPPASLRRPLERASSPNAVPVNATARALVETAKARLDSGDYPAAMDAAQRASSAAAASGDGRLEAESLAVLAGVLIHSVRGRDREAVGLLDRALELATRVGDERLAAEIERELGYVAFLAARYGAAESILRRSAERSDAVADTAGAARARTLIGACQSDRADFAAAEVTLVEAVERLRALGDRFEPFATSCLARVRLRTDRVDDALVIADEAAERSRQVGWLSLAPWPMTVAGEAHLVAHHAALAGQSFETAYALATEMDDPCWRAFALRGLGLVAKRDGDPSTAERLLGEAVDAAASQPDIYAWAEALILTDLVEMEAGRDRVHVERAMSIARRGPMPDLLARLSAVLPVAKRGVKRQTASVRGDGVA
jgi:DNA-binding SARP family transcriptional activator